jgi:hypothetical protein
MRNGLLTYVFDLDGTLCSEHNGKYELAQPFQDRINIVNRLYLQGHTIMIDSARGTMSKKDQEELTKAQLQKWGVKYHYLRTGVKYFGDIYVDNKGVKDTDFFK